ncbi:MAG: hypothetical protein KF749_16885 [Bacteroidetes bacterium]|nr:hypothetical protein [Bacteroidota bacterium]MCW5894568.1 hypothetical protein [Bacteroidota bacterium]
MRRTAFITLLVCSLTRVAAEQPESELRELTGHPFKVYFSPGHEERAGAIATRTTRALNYVGGLAGFFPEVTLYILSPEHWSTYGTFPVYGMAHYDKERLIVAAEDNDFWRSFLPPLEQLPADLAKQIKRAYTTESGTLSMRAFFDLLALHELGHAFHSQGGLKMQRLWMQELFCNIMLHTYIAENEPEDLPALEVFPEMVVASGAEGFLFTTLAQFEERYDNMDPRNYGWYQCRLHVAAKHIYEAGGTDAFVRLWHALKEQKEKLGDEEFALFLERNVHARAAQVQTAW